MGTCTRESTDEIKAAIRNPPCMAFYRTSVKTVLSADASSFGLSVVLLQIQEDGTKQSIVFASRHLRSAEQNWAQIEKEGLAIAWGYEWFSEYITGIPITTEIDHKPLLSIFKKKKFLYSRKTVLMQYHPVLALEMKTGNIQRKYLPLNKNETIIFGISLGIVQKVGQTIPLDRGTYSILGTAF
ncbi:hypothetical protein PR048_020787 [Dryococelus australis]|uniref:Reverse transcriptase/retrotransposon-derived protein RNase H-like domain-containing protein n=1 Tax=Dryococelus australis TaxID=614101 RepID=A0ABQ9GWD6_9NEOP|nr:hypothetical protein PR048_020787 [Dryococelus australis]